MEKRTWTIIKFLIDNTVEAIPSIWIENNKCYWPPFKYEQIIAAIWINVERNSCWPYDYNVTRLKNRKAECISDLNSKVEASIKRKKTKNRLYMSDTDDCNEYNYSSTKQIQIKDLFPYK
ncbi:hypothetical protein ACFW04_013752 [Cataglyphis niger]